LYQAPPGVLAFASLEQAAAHCRAAGTEKLFVIGGAQVYAQALSQADEMVLTHVPDQVEGDAFFPAWSPDEWEIVDRREQGGLRFVTYRRQVPGAET
jgi:dihydrofolate reductase